MSEEIDQNMPSEAQQDFAEQIAQRLEIDIDENILINKADLSQWIDEHKDLPTQKQLDLVNKIINKNGDKLTDDILADSILLSEYIDENIHLLDEDYKPSKKAILFAKSIFEKTQV